MKEYYKHTLFNKINKLNTEFSLIPLVIQNYLAKCMSEKMVYNFPLLMDVSFNILLIISNMKIRFSIHKIAFKNCRVNDNKKCFSIFI